MASRNASPAASGEAAPPARAVAGDAGDGERAGGDDRHGTDGGADDLALGATGRVRGRLDGRDDRRRRVTDGRDGRRRWAERAAAGGAGSRPVGGVAMCRRCSRSLLGPAAGRSLLTASDDARWDQSGTAPRLHRRPYPLRRARRRHRFPRIDRNGAAGAAAGRRPRRPCRSSGRRPSTARSAGTRRPGASTPASSPASTPSSTWPAPASATTAGPTTTSARSSRAARRATALLARDDGRRRRRPARPAVRLGDRLLRRPRRRGARRALGAGHRVPRRGGRGSGRPARRRPQAAGVRVAHLRTGIVLAPKGGALAKLLPLFKFGVGGRFGSGTQWMSWISLDDEVVGDRAPADERRWPAPVNLTAPDAGDQRRARRHARRRAAPPDDPARAGVRPAAAARRRAGRRPAVRGPAGPAPGAPGRRLRPRPPDAEPTACTPSSVAARRTVRIGRHLASDRGCGSDAGGPTGRRRVQPVGTPAQRASSAGRSSGSPPGVVGVGAPLVRSAPAT